MSALFTIGPPERAALDKCTYCPKMCRFSCPVSHADRTETLTPWGKMTLVALDDAGLRPLDAESAKALYGCSGCLRCQTYCRHGNDVPRSLYAGRATAMQAGLAPDAARAAVQSFRDHGDARGEDLAPALDALRGARGAHTGGGPVYFPGCDALRGGAGPAADTLAASAKLGEPLVPWSGPPCCGLPLLEAGDVDAFARHAERMVQALGGAREVVTSSARCARAFRAWYPEAGVTFPANVHHVASRWRTKLPRAAPLALDAAYHDPCSLGRGLGEYDAPRAVVAAALGRPPAEAPRNREESDCCGGAGLVPLTMPEVARTMARELAASLGAPQRTIVTACPTCVSSLQGAGATAMDLGTLVARWLGEGSWSSAPTGGRQSNG